MSLEQFQSKIDVLDVSTCSFPERVCAAALQGLVNRRGPRLFLDYGIYDDPLARRTNEVFLDDEIWFGKYRAMLGAQDQRNLDYYCKEHGVRVHHASDLDDVVTKFRAELNGCVVWDADQPDTANIALMLAAQENLLVVEAGMLEWATSHVLSVVHDLRKEKRERSELYRWAFETFFSKCKQGEVACLEPDWQRPEFIDYLVQNKIFTYNLSSLHKGPGSTLLLLLSFGPAWLRELLFALRLDAPIRQLAVFWMGRRSPEVRLATQIQRAVKSPDYPTIFGWHTRRDDELAFMLLLSANGLRLVPAHLASNFSFHSQVKPLGYSKPEPKAAQTLDPQGVYLTFTLSDGDQLMMMSTAEMGNWYSPNRGKVPFNWETQPLLIELAPALLEKFMRSATALDCLVAGPSGAGYIVPPLAPDLPAYLRATGRICRQAGINIVTTYVPDPPRRVLRQLAKFNDGLIGYLAGYAMLGRTPQTLLLETPIIANQVPTVDHIWDNSEKLLESVRQRAVAPGPLPRFIGVHLFAYRTGIDDVARFAETITDEHIHIVHAAAFLSLAKQHLQSTSSGRKNQ